ncbi:MAG: hypothetical protein Kow0042_28360 [Calditrichia bacterium]
MAKVAKNLVLHGASGKLGDQIVIKQWRGGTVLAAAPGPREGEPTAAQRAQHERFQQAIIYGKAQIADPEAKAEYAAKAGETRSAFNVAVADFFHAPQIDEIDVTGYSGQAGESIRVRVTDDFKVTQVQLSIVNADGSLVEQGEAVQQANGIDWVYTTTAGNPDISGDKIIVRASDKPGNISEGEHAL